MENLDLSAVVATVTKVFNWVKDSGILEKVVDAVKEYLPKIIEYVGKIGG